VLVLNQILLFVQLKMNGISNKRSNKEDYFMGRERERERELKMDGETDKIKETPRNQGKLAESNN
jgi:hypothetical protein